MTIETSTEGGVTVLRLDGDADLQAVPVLSEAVQAQVNTKAPALVVDFSGVRFVGTPVWAVMVSYYKRSRQWSGRLVLCGMTGRVEASFNMVRLGEFIVHRPTVAEALAVAQAPTEG